MMKKTSVFDPQVIIPRPDITNILLQMYLHNFRGVVQCHIDTILDGVRERNESMCTISILKVMFWTTTEKSC